MSIGRSMSQYNVPFVASMPPYLETQYIPTIHTSMLSTSAPHDLGRHSPHTNLPPSPSSSTGEHRVSKAKKGKRVHACEYPGCNKIFTRAEHRRRHELSHRAKKTYVCTHEGCTKAFHRADYLTQHMARHDSDSPKQRSPSLGSNSASPVSAAQSATFSAKSPVVPDYHSPVTNPSAGTPSSADQSMIMCSSCFNCQNQGQNCGNHGNSMYQYPTGMTQPLLGSPASALLSNGLDTAIDQYLRSVLRPEAFITPPQPQENISSSFWGANIDPHLSQMNPSPFQHPTSYPWSSSSSSMPPAVQTGPPMHQNSPHTDTL
ncbi:uncharacterized protein N7459_003068 [Penicillium hispanicum]|uniref:uncharacterized protein n=1 Tax=Penicillium hispanicum TaxID=1080232 RepID=UPI00253F6A25|nr:uncharacterized protein N7459_003068 [Penicillium hispanicum]KAJ5587303.1 hypothetical protein N7459_003068 [Penicillium hispanicum]